MALNDDDELCLCFHVTRRKVKNFIRIHQPRVAGEGVRDVRQVVAEALTLAEPLAVIGEGGFERLAPAVDEARARQHRVRHGLRRNSK